MKGTWAVKHLRSKERSSSTIEIRGIVTFSMAILTPFARGGLFTFGKRGLKVACDSIYTKLRETQSQSKVVEVRNVIASERWATFWKGA